MKNTGENRIFGWLCMVCTVSVLAIVGSLFVGTALPASAQDNSDRVVVGENLTIQKGEVVNGNVTVTNGNLSVLGEVLGKVIVVQGDASIEGTVKGDVVVTNGDVELGPKSVVGGNILTMGGSVDKKKGATVHGSINAPQLSLDKLPESILPPSKPEAPSSMFAPTGMFRNMLGLFGKGLVSLVLLALGLGLAALIPSRVLVSSATLEAEPLPSLIVGLITAFLIFPVVGIVAFVLFISIIGIPLLPVLGVAVLVALLFGLVAVSAWIGRLVYDGTHHAPQPAGNHLFVQVLIGMSIVLGTTLVPTMLLPNAMTALMVMLLYFASCVGIASAILSKFGTLVPPKHMHLYHRVPVQSAPAQYHPAASVAPTSSLQQPASSDAADATTQNPTPPLVK